jgi:hypothetical protein
MKFESLAPDQNFRLIRHFHDRYGVPEPFFDLLEWRSNKHFGWLASREIAGLLSSDWNTQGVGLLLLVDLKAFKPTTLGIRFLAPQISRNRIELESRLVPAFLNGSRLDLSDEQVRAIDSTGYIVVFCQGDCLGSAYADLSRKTLHPNLSKTRETDFIEARGFVNQLHGPPKSAKHPRRSQFRRSKPVRYPPKK